MDLAHGAPREESPWRFPSDALAVTEYEPPLVSVVFPEISPVEEFSDTPAGRPLARNVSESASGSDATS